MVLGRRLVHLLGVLALAATWSCSSGGDGDPAADGAPVPSTVGEVLERSAAAMSEVRHATFELTRSGAPVALDPAGQLVFESAEGRYVAPGSAEARIEVLAGGLRTRIAAVAIDGSTWLTNPLTGRWEVAPPGMSFDPAVLFDPATGFPALLRDELIEPELLPSDDDDDRQLVRGTIDADQVSDLTGGLAEEPTEVELVLDAATGRVVECRFDVVTEDGTSAWVLELPDYGEAAAIERPEPGSTG